MGDSDNTHLSFLNLGVWNNRCNTTMANDLWPMGVSNHNTNSAKLNGIVSQINKTGKQMLDSKQIGAPILSPWTTNNSLLRDLNKLSIWSSDTDGSVSGPPWCGILTPSAEGLQSVDVWDSSRDPIFPVSVALTDDNTWKPSQRPCLTTTEENFTCSISSSEASINHSPINLVSTESSTFNHSSASRTSDVSAILTGLVSSRNACTSSVTEPVSQVKAEGSSSEYPVATAPGMSTEQLCDRLINSNDGWGRRPVDQTTPWELPDLKTTDQFSRSGITTPTPGSCSGPPRLPFQTHNAGSNVWTSEPPTGNGIWEMHYENLDNRPPAWQSTVTPTTYEQTTVQSGSATSITPIVTTNLRSSNQALSNRPTQRDWEDNEKRSKYWTNTGFSSLSDRNPMWMVHPNLPEGDGINSSNRIGSTQRRLAVSINSEGFWNSGGIVQTVTGRPVLGCTRPTLSTSNQPEDHGWNNDSHFGRSGLDGNGGTAPWDALPNGSVTSSWSSSGSPGTLTSHPTQLASPPDDLRRQTYDCLFGYSYNNTYRADLVKFLMNQGFKKEDAQAALIDCNMEPERALHELRERYSSSRMVNSLNQSSTNGDIARNFGANNSLAQQAANNLQFSQFVSPTNNNLSNNNHRPKQPTSNGTSNTVTGNHLIPTQMHANSQLVRQQVAQQIRSALNMSLPNQVNVPSMNSGNSLVSTCGGSLLGQPPPPSLSSANLNSQGIPVPNPPSSLGGLTSVIGPGNQSKTNRLPFLPGTYNSTSTSKRSIINAMIELQKKHQSIQHQLLLYSNTPALCSQPQYADVLTELQGQIQHIEAQLKAKHTQLSFARGQDIAAISSKGQQTLPSNCNSVNDGCDGTFPAIGTWITPQTGTENLEKSSVSDAYQPKPNHVVRTTNTKNCSAYNNSSIWSPTWSTHSVSHSTSSNQRATAAPAHASQWQLSTGQLRSNSEHKTNSALNFSNDVLLGQWLKVQPSGASRGMDISHLHTMLSTNFRLTSFHVIDLSTCSVLIRLQAKEDAFSLIPAFSDRLDFEFISEMDARTYIEQRCLNTCSDNIGPNQFSSISESQNLCNNWTSDQLLSTLNSNVGNKKPNPYISRSGTVVCGNK